MWQGAKSKCPAAKWHRTEVGVEQCRDSVRVAALQNVSLEEVFADAAANTFQSTDILTQLSDCLHLLLNKLRLQPVGHLCTWRNMTIKPMGCRILCPWHEGLV